MPGNHWDTDRRRTSRVERRKGTSRPAFAVAPGDAPSPPPTAPAADATLTHSFFYSSRRAVMGSRREAGEAGKYPATKATIASTAAADPKTQGSFGVRP